MRAFVVAMECEAARVRPLMKDSDRLYVCGIGKVNAAAATQKAIDEGAREIVNAGVVGGFSGEMEVGDVFEVSAAVEYDFDLSEVNGTLAGQLEEFPSPYLPMVLKGVFPSCRLASGDHFTDNPAEAEVLERLGCSIRDMEGAAIAHVCLSNSVKCRSLKCVSDVHGKGSMIAQYKRNLEFALDRLEQALAAWI